MLVGDDHGAYHLSPRFISLARAAEAAETLGVPQGTIKSRTHYALHALRQAIDGASVG